jgi:hypothetical protein
MQTLRRGLLAGLLAGLVLAMLDFVTDGTPGRSLPEALHWFGIAIANPTISKFAGFFLLLVLGGGVWSHLWRAPEGEDDHDQSRAPLGACARLCLVARLLTAACEHHEPPGTFQPRFWEVPFHVSHRPAFRGSVGGNLLPTTATACSSGNVGTIVCEKRMLHHPAIPILAVPRGYTQMPERGELSARRL